MTNTQRPKSLVDPEWGERFSRNLDQLAKQAQRDARRAGEQIGRALTTLAERTKRQP